MVGTAVDTATEVALLAISAAAPGQGIPIYLILLLPSLFTAAMAMIDTLDGILMVSKTKHPLLSCAATAATAAAAAAAVTAPFSLPSL